jgi:hypothetical protein
MIAAKQSATNKIYNPVIKDGLELKSPDELPITTYWTECISIARLDYQILPVFLSVLASALVFFFFGADDSLSDSESADEIAPVAGFDLG